MLLLPSKAAATFRRGLATIHRSLASTARVKATEKFVAFIFSGSALREISTGPSHPKSNAGGASAAFA